MTLICRAILHQEGALFFMIKKIHEEESCDKNSKIYYRNSCLLQLGLSKEGCDNQLL